MDLVETRCKEASSQRGTGGLERSRLLVGVVVLALCMALFGGGASAQEGNATEAIDVQASALSTAFNYQGQLLASGEPVTDECSMIFSLYDSAIGGNMIGTPISTTVTVTDGLFSVNLNFGSGAFTDEIRWLGIQAKGSSDASFANLGRQELVASPYALYSLSAGTCDTAATATTALTANTATTALTADTAITATLATTATTALAANTATTATTATTAGNADTVDNLHAANMARVARYVVTYPGGSADITIPHFQTCQITIGEVFGTPDNVAWLSIAENDYRIAWVGMAGDGTAVHGTALLNSTDTVITVGTSITLSCPNVNEYKLVLTSTHEDVVATVTW